MTTENERGFAPTVADIEYESLRIWWREECGFNDAVCRWLALYQYAGGNAFGLKDLDGRITYAPRPEA